MVWYDDSVSSIVSALDNNYYDKDEIDEFINSQVVEEITTFYYADDYLSYLNSEYHAYYDPNYDITHLIDFLNDSNYYNDSSFTVNDIEVNKLYRISYGASYHHDIYVAFKYVNNNLVPLYVGTTERYATQYELSLKADSSALSNKVDKVSGKQLSTEDYTSAEKTKLSGLSNYTHPTAKQCNYAYTHPTTKQCNASIPSDVSDLTDNSNTQFTPKAHTQALSSITDADTVEVLVTYTDNTTETLDLVVWGGQQ